MFDYIKKFGHFSFSEKPLTEIDNVILSYFPYADFNGIIPPSGSIKFSEAATNYLNTHPEKEVSKIGVAMARNYKLMTLALKYPRYQNLELSKYRYIIDSDTQFSALTFRLDDGSKFIAFEGTDQMISGWKEDFYMPFCFPVDAHRYAIKYINEAVSVFDHDVIVGGHSKGGNLALVAAMYGHPLVRHKIKRIFSNDGPGLRREEFETKKFDKVRARYTHLMPDHSLVGIMLHNDKDVVIDSSKKNLFCHDATTWRVQNDHFVRTELSEKSKRMHRVLRVCSDDIPHDVQEKIIRSLFEAAQKQGYSTTLELLHFRGVLNLIKELRGISPETKKLIGDAFQLALNEYRKK